MQYGLVQYRIDSQWYPTALSGTQLRLSRFQFPFCSINCFRHYGYIHVRTINFGPCSTSDQMLNFGPFYVELRTLFNLGPHSRWDHQLLNFGPVHVRTTFTLGPTTFQGFSYTVADQKVLYQKVLHFLVMSCPPKSVTYFQKTK